MENKRQIETCLVIVTGLIVFYFIFNQPLLLKIAIAIGVIGAFIPSIAKWIDFAWYKLAEGMGYVMSKVLLSLVFFLFLFPIAALYRLTKKDTLQLKRKKDTYWTDRSHDYTAKDLENIW
jgi:hypothetical protein